MSTIRQRLTRRLLASWALLLLLGGGVAYVTTRAALTRQFDDALRTKALALTTITEQDRGEIMLEVADLFMREFDADVSTAFYQLWRGDGAVVDRSPSLHGADLPRRGGTLGAPEFWNLDGPGNAKHTSQSVLLPARAVGFRFQPKVADDSAAPTAAVEAILVVAADRRELDQALATLALVLGGSGLLVLLLTAALGPVLLRRELAPLDRVADQAQHIDAGSLATRFPTEDLPGELAPITARLNDLLQRLQTAFERERQFSNDLAHEFRTPIAELRSLAELSLKWPEARTADTDRTTLAIAVQMESIVTRLLAIARREQEPVAVSSEPVNVADLIRTVCQPLQPRAASRHLAIETDLSPSPPIHSDPVLLRSIVTNLLENAVEYAPAGSAVRIQSEQRNGGFALCVANPAGPLNAGDLPHLFDRFWRKDTARSGAAHSGLGLSLARAFATSMGYTLSAALKADACLVMTLTGPVKPECSNSPSPSTPPSAT
ncbi:MAG: HAMP domain-containing histidine kinase [Verrucomicrobia bacterium]|nr:HAMP domain-containing histidine kinase [Verrucomicrobiota bacterium]